MKDKRNIEGALLKKGFRKSEKDHHWFFYYTTAGVKTFIKTQTSHSKKGKALDKHLLGLMAREVFLRRNDFDKLIECSLRQDNYEKILIENNILKIL